MRADIEGMAAYLRAQGMAEEQISALTALAEQADDSDELDLDEAVACYDPAPEDAADEALVSAVCAWLGDTAGKIPAGDVTALWLGCSACFADSETAECCMDIWLAYNTAAQEAESRQNGAELWNCCNWADHCFDSMEPGAAGIWCGEKGFRAEDEYTAGCLLDLLAAAVMRLHDAGITEKIFGKKLPVIIADMESANEMTAVRAVRANGAELFDDAFFQYCGLEE